MTNRTRGAARDAAHPVPLDRRPPGRGPARADRPGLQPGHRPGHRPRSARRRGRGRRRGRAAAKAAFPAWRDTPLIARSQIFFAFRELVWRAPRGAGRAHHARPRQDLPRRPRRGPARPRDGRVRVRPAGPPRRHEHPQRRHEGRRVHPPPAARRHRRDHAVQLPGDGPDVDLPDRARLRQHDHPQAVLPHPGRDPAPGRAVEGGRPARTASSTSSTAAARRSPRSSSTRTSRRSSSSARPPSAATSTRRAPSAASASGPTPAPRTRCSSCPTPTWS